ncbi:MAG: TrkA C-terminal domain-containing protein [Spirochaetia bacterium]
MAAVISFFIILIISLFIVRIATVLLTLTGISREAAKFQARSAFTGTGFTTSEAEYVVSHPFRRRIIMSLMLLRNAGFVSVISTMILSFVNTQTPRDVIIRIGLLGGGALLLLLISRLRVFDRMLSTVVERSLKKFTSIRVGDYASLLNLESNYEISQFIIQEDSWMNQKNLMEMKLTEEGILILGIRRSNGSFVGTPQGGTYIHQGDKIIMYGQEDVLKSVGNRKSGPEGDRDHEEGVKKYHHWREYDRREASRDRPSLIKKVFKR